MVGQPIGTKAGEIATAGKMELTISITGRNSFSIIQSPATGREFRAEMELVQWYLIGALTGFYAAPPQLPETLAALYSDAELIGRVLRGDRPVLEPAEAYVRRFRAAHWEQGNGRIHSGADRVPVDGEINVLAAIDQEVLQRPVVLQPDNRGSKKFIRAEYPECRLTFHGFGRFFGYSDLNPFLFWSPFAVLRRSVEQHMNHSEAVATILTAAAGEAAALFARREIAADHQGLLASDAIQRISERYDPGRPTAA